MRIVIDTSVVVSAAFRDRVPEEVLLSVARSPHIEWIASTAIVTEYLEVLRRPKFDLPEAVLRQWGELLSTLVTLVETPSDVEFPRDPKDAPFLACAIAGDADYLITSDRDFAEAYHLLRTTVCSVAQFKRLVLDQES